MDYSSTFSILGLPEPLTTAVALVLLSLSLAPWLGGTELGPLKVPKLSDAATRWLRVVAPICLIFFSGGYLKLWPSKQPAALPLSYSEYSSGFYDTSKSQAIRGALYPLSELEMRHLRRFLGSTRWDGGANWGAISFDEAGRTGTYTNQSGRSPGTILIQGAPPGTVPIIIGEWQQKDGQSGRLMLAIPIRDSDTQLKVAWGPSFTALSEWKKQ